MFNPSSPSDLEELGRRARTFSVAFKSLAERRLRKCKSDGQEWRIELMVQFIYCRALAESLESAVVTEDNEEFLRKLVDDFCDAFSRGESE